MQSRFAGRRAIVTGAAGASAPPSSAASRPRGRPSRRSIAASSAFADEAIRAVVADIHTVDSARHAVDEAVAALGGPADIVVSAAGVYVLAPAASVEEAD